MVWGVWVRMWMNDVCLGSGFLVSLHIASCCDGNANFREGHERRGQVLGGFRADPSVAGKPVKIGDKKERSKTYAKTGD